MVPSYCQPNLSECVCGTGSRIHLNNLVSYLFGEQHNFYLTIQGRAAERLLLGALRDCRLVRNGDNVISNRPFDTTKGQILNHGLTVDALTPVASPDTYMNAEDPLWETSMQRNWKTIKMRNIG